MISNLTLQNLFLNCQKYLPDYIHKTILPEGFTQFFRGVLPDFYRRPFTCARNKRIFNTYRIIPKHCFSCYKIVVEPDTVVELFKLMLIFERLEKPLAEETRKKFLRLPNDNIRKCMVEVRPRIPGTYKGFIYCPDRKEAKILLQETKEVVAEEIANNILVKLKRGCSEFALLYPDFPELDDNLDPRMEYDDAWQEHERKFDKSNPGINQASIPNPYNGPSFNLYDTKVMLTWLKYAATIGDQSYLKITGQPVAKFSNLKRPSL